MKKQLGRLISVPLNCTPNRNRASRRAPERRVLSVEKDDGRDSVLVRVREAVTVLLTPKPLTLNPKS